MGSRTAQRCHYLNEENVPLSVAISEALTAYDRSRPTTGESPLHDYLDVELVDTLFTETLVKEEDVSVSLRVTLPDRCVDVHTERAHSDDPVRILVTETDE